MKIIISTLLIIHSSVSLIRGLDCPGPHEYQYDYTPVCPLDCDSLHTNRCTQLITKPSCQCKDGTIRDPKSGRCVNLSDCPHFYNPSLVCNKTNEEYSDWVSACPASCKSPTLYQCHALVYKPSCVCVNGYIRDMVNDICVLPEQCNSDPDEPTEDPNDLVCVGENEQLSPYTTCYPTCKQPDGPSCHSIIKEPSCVCSPDFIRDTDSGKCVQKTDCPQN